MTVAADQLTDGRITVELSHAGKVLFPGDGITKGDLVQYYFGTASVMLPLLRDRPLTLIRYPDGIDSDGVLQKNAPRYFPDWITRAPVPRQTGGTVQHVIADKPATLAYLANQACIELHAALSKRDALERPDQLIFDLDPPDDRHFADVRRAAGLLRELLEDEVGLACYVKTTGGKGVHVHVALRPGDDFDATRDFARQAADVLVAREPRLLTTEQRRDKRGSRIYADILRNGYAQTAVAPYAVRARPGAPVAMPLSWAELDDPGLSPHDFTITTVPGRLAGRDSDPWASMPRRRYRLSRARDKLRRLTG